MTTSRITDYLSGTVAASRPATPAVPTGGAALNVATDTGAVTVYNGTAWSGPLPVRLFLSSATAGNAADATEDVMQTYTMPANTLKNTGQTLRVTAFGRFAANADTKTLKLYFGTTDVANVSLSTNSANHTWWLEMLVTKSAANTQRINCFGGHATNALGTANGAPVGNYEWGGGATETDTSNIVIKVTGQDSGSAANGVQCDLMVVELLP